MQAQAIELEHVWHRIGAALGGIGQSAAQMDELTRMEKFGEAIKRLIGTTIEPQRLSTSGRDFTAGYVSLLSGKYMEAGVDHSDILDLIRASAALPPLFPCVPTKEDLLVDGGYRNITPLASAFKAEQHPDEVYVLLTRRITNPKGRLSDCTIEPQPLEPDWASRNGDPKKLYAQVATRLVDILMDEVYIEDVKRAVQENALARLLDELEEASRSDPKLKRFHERAMHRRPKHVKLHVLAPLQRFNPEAAMGQGDSVAAFDAALIERAIEHGAEVAADRGKWVWHPEREKYESVAADSGFAGSQRDARDRTSAVAKPQ
jgi:NTE family protein